MVVAAYKDVFATPNFVQVQNGRTGMDRNQTTACAGSVLPRVLILSAWINMTLSGQTQPTNAGKCCWIGTWLWLCS